MMAGALFPGACEKCKERHVKCDMQRPSCMRCTNIGVACPGYIKRSVFVDERANIERRARRRKTIASSDNAARDAHNALSSFNNKSESDTRFDLGQGNPKDYRYMQDVVLVPELSPTYHFGPGMDLQNPMDSSYTMPANFDPGGSNMATSMPSTDFLSGAPLNPLSNPVVPQVSSKLVNGPGSETFPDTSSAHSTPVLGTESHLDAASSANLMSPSNYIEQSSFFAEFAIESEHEMAFLVRHFSEVIGPWFDLYDCTGYYQRHVPLKVHDSPLLRYATAAIAAKQLGRVQGKKTTKVNVSGRYAMTESYPGAEYVDWHYKAANYYHKAVSYLRISLRDKQAWDEFLSGATILSVYEILDGSREELTQHLSGIKSLLDQVVKAESPVVGGMQASKQEPSHAARAAFWVFVREDYVNSYIERRKTYLNTEDVSTWRFFGLRISDARTEDDFANLLMWIICRIVNFLASSNQMKASKNKQPSTSRLGGLENSSVGDIEDCMKHNAKRLELSTALDSWINALPATFTPCTRIDNPQSSYMGAQVPTMPFPEVYFSIPACAAAIQFYHFARTLLLLDELQDNFQEQYSTSTRLRHYREVSRKINSHCREVCAIAVGRPPGSVRIHLPQPLFLAGQCLEDLDERKFVVELLREIERDVGWATEYRAKQLLAECE